MTKLVRLWTYIHIVINSGVQQEELKIECWHGHSKRKVFLVKNTGNTEENLERLSKVTPHSFMVYKPFVLDNIDISSLLNQNT